MRLIYKIQRLFATLVGTLISKFDIWRQNIICGKKFRTCGKVLLKNEAGKGGFIIGSGVNINSRGTRNPGRVEGMTILITKETGHITIGNNVGMSNCVMYSASGITIGDNCTIGAGTKLFDTDGSYIYRDVEQLKSKPITIGNRVFIGGNVIVLKGVTIGDEAVVGSGAVVTKDIGPREIWAGNPAKFLKRIETRYGK